MELSFKQQLNELILFHLEEHASGQKLLQFHVFAELYRVASKTLPVEHGEPGNLVAINGSMIEATLTMTWTDYRDGSKKAKAYVGFDLNTSIPSKIYLDDGNSDERPNVSTILEPGQTGVIDRYYQCYRDFDAWQAERKHFVCRIKAHSHKTRVRKNDITPDGPTSYDAVVLLGFLGINQTESEVRVIGYRVGSKHYWLATDRFDLSAENIMTVYKLRSNTETFFGWWKQHLNDYHRIARSSYGMMVHLLAGLITYLLLAIYCHETFNEPVCVKRVRYLHNSFRAESRNPNFDPTDDRLGGNSVEKQYQSAKT